MPLKVRGTRLLDNGLASTTASPFDRSTSQPKAASIWDVISTSPMSGQFEIVEGEFPRSDATKCLVTAFLDPRTATSPVRGPIGSTIQASVLFGSVVSGLLTENNLV